MDHEYYSDLLSAYLDRELTPEEEAMMTEHLADCPECRAQLERLKEADRLVQEHSALSDGDYWEKSALAIEEKLGIGEGEVTDIRPKKRSSGLWWKLTGVAASAAILAFIGLNQDKILRDGGAIEEKGVETTVPASVPQADHVAVKDEIVEDVAADVESVEEQAAEAPGRVRAGIPVPVSDEVLQDKDAGDVAIGIVDGDYAPTISVVSDAEESASTPSATHDAAPQVISKAPPLPPPGAPPKKAPRSPVATTGTQPEAEQTITLNSITMDESEQNYKSRKRVVADVAVDQPQEEMAAAEGSIESWRAVRDNLLGEKELVSKQKVDSRNLTSGFASRSSSVGAADREIESAQDKETKLLEAWYNVIRVSEDSAERARGIKYIREVANRKDSPNREKAKEYLRLLDL